MLCNSTTVCHKTQQPLVDDVHFRPSRPKLISLVKLAASSLGLEPVVCAPPWNRTRSSGSTHLASTGRPTLVRRRAVDPIWPRPGPVPPAAERVLLPLHIRSLSPRSPFLRCGPGPFNLPLLTETGTNGIVKFSVH